MLFFIIKKGSVVLVLQFIKRHVLISIIILAVIIGIFLTKDEVFLGNNDNVSEVEQLEVIVATEEAEKEVASTILEKFMIDVKGEVVKPGVYAVNSNLRVNDVIKLAGGFTVDADESQINLAQKVQDEMVIFVVKEGEDTIMTPIISNNGTDNGQGVKINVASLEEITSLSGIGPAKAQAIINYREEHGLFQTVEDLLQVSGIGEKTLDNFKDEIIVP